MNYKRDNKNTPEDRGRGGGQTARCSIHEMDAMEMGSSGRWGFIHSIRFRDFGRRSRVESSLWVIVPSALPPTMKWMRTVWFPVMALEMASSIREPFGFCMWWIPPCVRELRRSSGYKYYTICQHKNQI